MSDGRIPISEIFGPVIQGEGARIGRQTVFIRTGGCDSRCSFCDTLYAVDAKDYSHTWERLTPDELLRRVRPLLPMAGGSITLSGGNPAMWDFGPVLPRLKALAEVNVETQGTLWPAWFKDVDHITFSPKPPSAGPAAQDIRLFCGKLNQADLAKGSYDIKVVIRDIADLNWFEELRHALKVAGLYPGRAFVQPCNTSVEQPNVEEMLGMYRWLATAAIKRRLTDVVVLPQLHVLAYGGGRGV